MTYLITKPSARFSPFVKQYWLLENCLHPGKIHKQRIIPTGLTELNFYFSDLPKSNNTSHSISDNITISGQINQYFDLSYKSNISMFSVSFKPLGARYLLNLPLAEIRNTTVGLRDLLDISLVNELESQLFEARSFYTKTAIIEKFLSRYFLKNSPSLDTMRISDSIQYIDAKRANIDVVSLARRACLSYKQYERVFKEQIGITPKQFLRIVRFQNAIFSSQDSKLNLTELAYTCFYFDQSHMINEFKSLAGTSPRRLLRKENTTFSDYFHSL